MFNKIFNSTTIPKINLLVTSTGLSFQVFILNPWHSKISNQITNLENAVSSKKLRNT